MKNIVIILLIGCAGLTRTGVCQSTIFSIMQDPQKQASKNYNDGNYSDAILVYQNLLDKNPDDYRTQLKLAQAYFRIKEYEKSIAIYDSYRGKGHVMPFDDLYLYAEAQSALKNHTVAVQYYKQCLALEPDNELVAKKVWRINNLQYLYEDSAHYAIRSVAVNTTYGELSPVPYKKAIVFTSNRKGGAGIVEKVNGKMNTPFYQLYSATWKKDSTVQGGFVIGKATGFAKSLKSRFNTGPVAFYNKGTQMVFVTTSDKGDEGDRTLGLYFATVQNNKWKLVSSYPHNSVDYSISDITISEDGTRMYFSSDMKGGIGGKDIYTSQFIDGRWSKPRNLGEAVNTSKNEVFPYLHADGSLYFSSDGHAGIGELDIFRTLIKSDGYGEPQNVGYPLNSNHDDFGVSFDSLATHGYLTSNRKNGGFDDDIYEFDMDLQTYPFAITGVIKYKEHTWSDLSEIHTWPSVKISLIDSWLNASVYEGNADADGNFSISIPYFSKYYIRIVDEEGVEHKVSLELQKYRAETYIHEIVVVKDIYTQNADQK